MYIYYVYKLNKNIQAAVYSERMTIVVLQLKKRKNQEDFIKQNFLDFSGI